MKKTNIYQQLSMIEKYYTIDNNGDMYSKKTGKKIKYYISKKGYAIVTLRINGEKNNYSVHRLVASKYVPNPENKPNVNHKDANRFNYNPSNLEWCTQSENNIHCYRTMGVLGPRSKQVTQYTLDGEEVKTYPSSKHAFRAIGVNPANIRECCKGNRGSAGGFKWAFTFHRLEDAYNKLAEFQRQFEAKPVAA